MMLRVSGHELRQFTYARLDEVRQRWFELAGEDEFGVELTLLFDWCVTHLFSQSGDSQAHELYNPDTGQTDAILEMIHSRRGAKLLKLYLSPEFWVVESREDRLRVVRLHAAAFTRAIVSGIVAGAGIVKIYGRSELMLTVLEGLERDWPGDEVGWDAALQGRWLAITERN